MVGWVFGGGVAAIGLWLLARARTYERLFSNEHFSEIARAAVILKAAALERVDESDEASPFSPADPRAFVTRANLLVFYTVWRRDEQVVHHVSVSVLGDITARAVGTTFVAWFAMLVGLPVDQVVLEVAPTTVHHGKVTLTRSEHDRTSMAPVLDVAPAYVAGLRRACLDARSRMKRRGS